MDAADEQRLLHILRAAKGDPAALALVPLDVTFADRTETERARLRQALIAAAVPHWFDEHFLAALLVTSKHEAFDLMGKLQRLTNIEPFPERGASAYNVHEASRHALRQQLRAHQPDLWHTYALRAHNYLSITKEPHERIEALFHLFAANAEGAISQWRTLDSELNKSPATEAEFSRTLHELASAGWLTGTVLTEVLRMLRRGRDSIIDLTPLTDKTRGSAQEGECQFHVFLCHHSEDKPEVERIGHLLKKRGLRPWLDKWELPPGRPWIPALEKQIETIGSAAVFVGSAGIGPWQREEIHALLIEFQALGRPVIPIILEPIAVTPKIPVFLKGRTWVNFQDPKSLPLEQLLWGITGEKSDTLRNCHDGLIEA